jgi:hypothetical protein
MLMGIGTFGFNKSSYNVKEDCVKVNIEIERQGRNAGKVEVWWKTKDDTAFNGKDYIGGEVIFDIICAKVIIIVLS